jgi:hypothetical protein
MSEGLMKTWARVGELVLTVLGALPSYAARSV